MGWAGLGWAAQGPMAAAAVVRYLCPNNKLEIDSCPLQVKWMLLGPCLAPPEQQPDWTAATAANRGRYLSRVGLSTCYEVPSTKRLRQLKKG